MIQKPRRNLLEIMKFVRRLIFSFLYTLPCKKIQHHECLKKCNATKVDGCQLHKMDRSSLCNWSILYRSMQLIVTMNKVKQACFKENHSSACLTPSNLYVRTCNINELLKLIIN